MFLESFKTEGLSIYTYLIGCGSEAAVIDPTRDISPIIQRLRTKNVKLKYIFETHIHADFLSGARQLSSATGAPVVVSGEALGGEETIYGYGETLVSRNGTVFEIGQIRMELVHTPGHTPEHASYLLTDLSRSSEPLMLFSGDFIFVGSVGRPDLLGAGPARPLANALYDSIYEGKIGRLPDHIQIFPGHGSGSACGKAIGDVASSTLGIERQFNEAFGFSGRKQDFMDYILSNQPAAPAYFSMMKKWNRQGPALMKNTDLRSTSFFELPAFIDCVFDHKTGSVRSDIQVLDIRQPTAFAGGFIPGSLSIWFSPNLATWAGWFLNYNQPIYLVYDNEWELGEAVCQMRLIGFDNIEGAIENGFDDWLTSGNPIDHIDTIDCQKLEQLLSEDNVTVLDIRTPDEFEMSHISNAIHIETGYLSAKIKDLDPEKHYLVMCGGGYRASLAASFMKNNGFMRVSNILGGMTAWESYQNRKQTIEQT